MWQLPLCEEYNDSLKSSIADLINAGSKGKAGAQNGGLFIQEFPLVKRRQTNLGYILI